MTDRETNLHPKNNPNINLKPNIVTGNIPDKAVTFKQLDDNLQNKINSHSFQIAKNTADISSLREKIDDEASTREDEDSRIREEVFQYVDNINSNLQEKISTNKTDIAKNTGDIAKNTSDIDKNTADITKNTADIAKNTEDITKNTSDIDKNTADITKNTADIAKNTADIEKNTADIEKQNQRVLLKPSSAPSTRKVVTIDTNGAQDNVDGTELTTLMSNIVDNNGHKRFVEFNGVAGSVEGITITYNKASLSGTHLMVVLAGSIANGTTIDNSKVLAFYNIPAYIMDKIKPVWGSNIEVKTVTAFATDWSSQSFQCVLAKNISTQLGIFKAGPTTFTADRNFRIQFDLLVDSE